MIQLTTLFSMIIPEFDMATAEQNGNRPDLAVNLDSSMESLKLYFLSCILTSPLCNG